MSASFVASSALAIKQITIYGGIFLIVTGVIGGLLNSIVLLSLQTFRQSSCAFYLTIMSMANIGQLFVGVLLSRLMITIFGIDLTIRSLFYCKCQSLFFQLFMFTSFTCLCLATIDQYCATCSRLRWQKFCNVKLARRLTAISICIIILHGIPPLVVNNHIQSSVNGNISCVSTNAIYTKYRTYVSILILGGFLPVTIASIFGIMAYHNVQQLAYRTVPLVRRELDKQLTVMVLIQVVVNAFALTPYTIVNVLALNTSITSDPVSAAKLQISSNVTFIMYYIYFAVSII
jgi:hypothetical protein